LPLLRSGLRPFAAKRQAWDHATDGIQPTLIAAGPEVGGRSLRFPNERGRPRAALARKSAGVPDAEDYATAIHSTTRTLAAATASSNSEKAIRLHQR